MEHPNAKIDLQLLRLRMLRETEEGIEKMLAKSSAIRQKEESKTTVPTHARSPSNATA
jgi:hypothetical protein